MIQTSLIEQISIFFNLLKNSPYFLGLLVAFVISLGILLLANKFKNKKITKILCILVYTAIFGTLIYFYHQEVFKLLDYLVENIFLFLFFPNLAVYMLVLIIINVIIIRSTFTKEDNKVIRVLNIICFLVFNVIFFFIIQNIVTNKINVYEQLSIYTNQELLVLIELNMQLFILWLCLLLLNKIITLLLVYTYSRKGYNKNLVLEEVVSERENDNFEFTSIKKEIIPSLVEEITYDEIIPEEPKKTYNIYNDYVDIIPIKKQKVSLENTIITLDKEVQKEVEVNNNVWLEPIKEINIENEKKQEEFTIEDNKSSFKSLTSYEDIFLNDNQDFKKNMDNVFSNSYLKEIASDIEKLKYDIDNKNAIKLVYDHIKLYENELSLSDYNHLISMLTDIKK